MASRNPWKSRFAGLERISLRERMAVAPAPVRATPRTVTEQDIRQLSKNFDLLFYPTERVLDVAERLVDLARGHSAMHYSTKKRFADDLYRMDVPLPILRPATTFIGLAGVGKSELIHRLYHCLPGEHEIEIPRHGVVRQKICWLSRMDGTRWSPARLLMNYLAADGEPPEMNTGKHVLRRFRKRAFQRGIALVVTDEAQFVTMGDGNATITNSLIQLALSGLPNVGVANYSLIHKLNRRPQEDKQRLLSDPLILLPDTPDSEDWLWTVEAFRSQAPEIFKFKSIDVADDLHYWTAGLKRLLGQLLIIAATIAKANKMPVTYSVLERAFASVLYSSNRTDVELLHQQARSGAQASSKRRDLWCPFELPQSYADAQKAAVKAADRKKVFNAYAGSSMTRDARALHEKLVADKENPDRKKATVSRTKSSSKLAKRLQGADGVFQETC